jgi:serine phosphatase RsbU (regulator of sigma subunit)
MPDDLALQNARLEALHEVALSLTSTLELPQVLQRVLEMAQTLSSSANAHIFLYDAERDDLYLAASHWSPSVPVLALRPRRAGITWGVVISRQPAYIENTDTHPAYAGVPASERAAALACLPLVKGDRVLGTLNLGFNAPRGFDPATRSFLDLMSRHAAIAIEQSRLLEVAVEKARLQRELELARQLQASLLPDKAPQAPGWDFAALWRPATLVAGDFYDFIPSPSGLKQHIVVADVSDKGMAAALFMALARSTIRGSITDGCCPEDAIDHANKLLLADSLDGMFVTAFYGQLDIASGQMLYVNAGHNPPLLYRRGHDAPVPLERTGMALAVHDGFPYCQGSVALEPGDVVVMYTDGITEALDAQDREFGLDCLHQSILRRRDQPAEAIIAGIEHDVAAFVGERAPFDDITAVVVKRL